MPSLMFLKKKKKKKKKKAVKGISLIKILNVT